VIQAMQQRVFADGDALVSYDPNVRPALIANFDAVRASIERCIGAAHLVKASDEDAAVLYPGEPLDVVAQRWCDLGAHLVVVTLGASGAVAFGASGEIVRRPGLVIRVADTVGAGDSFAGGLLAGIVDSGLATCAAFQSAVEHRDTRIDAALEQAIVVSAITCERPGAEPPTRAELDARLASLGG
jgi:fructokinase